MSLEQAIHQRWAADESLVALLPTERVSTGISAAMQRPYASIVRQENHQQQRTNEGRLEKVRLDIHVWHDDHDMCRDIAEQILKTFDAVHFDLSNGGRVTRMVCRVESIVQHENGAWQATLDFEIRIHHPYEV